MSPGREIWPPAETLVKRRFKEWLVFSPDTEQTRTKHGRARIERPPPLLRGGFGAERLADVGPNLN